MGGLVMLPKMRRGPISGPQPWDEHIPGGIPQSENDEIDAFKSAHPDSVLSSSGMGDRAGMEEGTSPDVDADLLIRHMSQVTQPTDDVAGNVAMTGTGAAPRLDPASSPYHIQLPRLDDMSSSGRVHDLQGQLNTLQHPQGGIGRRMLKAGLTAAPTAVAAILGGSDAMGGAAAGTTQALDTQYQHKKVEEDQLLREIQQAQGQQMGEYQGQVRGAEIGAQMQANSLWRQAMLGNRENTANANRDSRESIAQGRNTTTLATHGLHPDGTPMSEQELPVESRARIMHLRAQNELASAQEELSKARAAGIPAQVELAKGRLQIAANMANTWARRAQTMEDTFEANYFGTNKGQPIPGAPMQLDAQGNPVEGKVQGFRPYAATGPTGTTRTKGQQGDAILGAKDDLVGYLKQHKGELGPIMGRVNNLSQLLGTNNPASQELRGRFESWISLHPAFHGFRGMTAVQKFEDAVGGYKQTPEGFIAAIEGMSKGVKSAQRGLKIAPGYQPPPKVAPGAPSGGSKPPGW